MSTTTSEITVVIPAAAKAVPRLDIVPRTAFYLESQGQPLFAWLHGKPDAVTVDHGVIICAPLGYEQLHAHRSLRHLADAVASANIPVLRFDWHGTGDSAGIDGDPARLEMWKANLRDAAHWMRRQLGCRRISLIGLRMGATLAALSSGEGEVDNLVLWDPVLRGRTFVREMRAIDLTADPRPVPAEAAPGDIEAAGFFLSQETAADLSHLNLMQDEIHCQRALIVARDDMPAENRLSDRLSLLGITVEQLSLPGVPEMLAEPHRGQVPCRAIEEIKAWLVSRIYAHQEAISQTAVWPVDSGSDAGRDLLPNELHLAFPSEVLIQHQPETGAPTKLDRRIRERTIQISSDPDLFGILCEPVVVREDLPAIVMLNAGSTFRAGPGRLHVHMAREFADRGFRCLRLDLCGLGDSVTANPAHENDPYAATAFRDINLTLQFLRQNLGIKRCLLMGLCSGAYAAFQAAAQIVDPMLVESVLINPLTFFWKEGMTIDENPIGKLVTLNYYLNSARKPEKWLKLISGQSKIGVLAAARLLIQRFTRFKTQSHSGPNPCANQNELGHPLQNNVSSDLARVAGAGRSLAMFFSKSDPGYRILSYAAGRQVSKLQKSEQLRLAFIAEADHTFSRRATRRSLIDSILSDLRRRYEDSSAG